MNNTYSIISLVGLCLAMTAPLRATVIFSETMGTPSATTTFVNYESADGFDNDALTFSGTGDVRTSTASSGYVGASGSGNAFLTNTGVNNLVISGINTTGYEAGSLDLTFGAYKSTIASNMSELVVEWKVTSDSTWTALSFATQPTGSGTAVWRLVSITGTAIAISSDISIRFTNTSTTPQFRLDDITLGGTVASSGVPEPSTYGLIAGMTALAGGAMQRRRKSAIVA